MVNAVAGNGARLHCARVANACLPLPVGGDGRRELRRIARPARSSALGVAETWFGNWKDRFRRSPSFWSPAACWQRTPGRMDRYDWHHFHPSLRDLRLGDDLLANAWHCGAPNHECAAAVDFSHRILGTTMERCF